MEDRGPADALDRAEYATDCRDIGIIKYWQLGIFQWTWFRKKLRRIERHQRVWPGVGQVAVRTSCRVGVDAG